VGGRRQALARRGRGRPDRGRPGRRGARPPVCGRRVGAVRGVRHGRARADRAWRALRLLRLSRAPASPARPDPASPDPASGAAPLDRLAAARQRQSSFLRAGGYLLAFICAGVAWRLPPVMDALARHPVLVLPELVTLLTAGTGLWLELVYSPPLAPRLPKPQRATIAALAMWSAWAVAYVLGLSNHAVFHGYDPAGGALSPVADQQITVALVWAVSACCFVPVIFVALLTWLSGNGDPDEELQRLARDGRQHPVVRGWGRPARGRPAR